MNRRLSLTIFCLLVTYAATAQIPETNSDPAQFDCVRGTPQPAIDAAAFPDRKFQLLDKTNAIETVEMPKGDKLIIRHGGCEYFVQTYRFETSRFQTDTTDILRWYKDTVKLLSEIRKANQSPVDMNAGIKALVNYIDVYEEKKLGEEIDFVDSEIRQFVTLDRIEKIGEGKFAVEVTFAIGPL